MNPEGLISVVVRTKNRLELLTRAIKSVADQDYQAIELIVVNDGGESVADVYNDFVDKFSLAELIELPESLGRSAAANTGLRAVTGEFVCFLDDDDWLAPDHFSILSALLKAQPESVLAYGSIECVAANDRSSLKKFSQPFDPGLLLIENYIPIHAALFRRSTQAQEPTSYFDETLSLYEDWDFWLQLQVKGEFSFTDSVVGYYWNEDESGHSQTTVDQGFALQALRKVLARWVHHDFLESAVSCIGRARFIQDKLTETESLRAESALALDKAQMTVAELEVELLNRGKQLRQTYQSAIDQVKAEAESRVDSVSRAYEVEISKLDGLLRQQRDVYEAEIEKQQSEMAAILASNSWRLLRPLRAVRRWLTGSTSFYDALLSLALWCYRLPILQGVLRHVPFDIKQRIRNGLYSRSSAAVLSRESTAVPVAKGGKQLVSIIIPVYNHAEHIAQCIDSALAQTYGPLEVLIYDDASPDPKVREILNGYKDSPRCTVIYGEENGGISKAQNQLLMASSGGVIAFLDCDDYLEPDAVERCMKFWQEDTVYLHSARVNVDVDGAEVSRICFEHLPRQDYFAENLERMFATHFKMIGRHAFARVGLFDPRFDSAQDYDILMRVAFHYPTSAFVYVPYFAYYHRLHEKQTTESMSDAQQSSTDIIQAEARMRAAIRKGKFEHKLSIIMLSFGKREQTLEAIRSLKRTVAVEHEIILFDNGSDESTVRFIRERIEGQFESLEVIYHDCNLGPAGGRRAALQYATGDWFLVFDNDEIAEPGWLEELLVRANSYPDVGAVCCKVIFPDESLQFSGGFIEYKDEQVIDLSLYDRGKSVYDLGSAQFRECDWCPIGATLFTVNPVEFLHEGYPNCFEDAGVSMGLRRMGKRLLNSPGSWVWHEHVVYQKQVDMKARYLEDRYNPKKMLVSLESFYRENGLVIYDEYVWRENGLNDMSRGNLLELLGKCEASEGVME